MIWNIIFIVLAIFVLVGVIILVINSGIRFHDKSEDIKMGMSEDEVMEIMEKDPVSIEYLKNGAYEWIYEKTSWGGWGMNTTRIEVIFDENGYVTSVLRTKTCDQSDSQK